MRAQRSGGGGGEADGGGVRPPLFLRRQGRQLGLHGGHLRTMTTLADIGAVIAPIVPAFYNRPKSVDDIVNHTCGRLLDLFGIDTGTVKRWKGGPAES
jgi:4-hydroxy-3-polyprenylbenzoate decarboxylase